MKLTSITRLDLPDQPGIYIFRDAQKRPLYIGRATSLRDRVKSYFASDLIVTRGPRIIDMVTKARSLTFEETDSVLEAIILESALIKKYQPFYNVDERDDKSSLCVIITEEEWPRVFLVRARDFESAKKEGKLDYEVKNIFGPYPHSGLIKEALKILRKLFPFRDKKADDTRHEAFYRAIGQSPETKEETLTETGTADRARISYGKTIDHLILFFEGRKAELREKLEKEMQDHADKMRFEEADKTKKLLYALDHINDMALLKREKSDSVTKQFRMEAFDVAHMAGENVVGVMVVSTGGQLDNSEYRKFKIKKDANNDIAGLVEVLSRRLNHSEWAYPDLIVVDGNETHVKAAESVLMSRRISIPVVGVTKDDRHKAARLIGREELLKAYKKEIVGLNAEAHRFAIRYHRDRRRVSFV